MKKAEQFQLELRSGELLSLLHELGALYRFHRKRGIPPGRIELVKIEQQLAKLLQLSEPELANFLGANSDDAIKTIRRVLNWLARDPAAAQKFATDDTQLPQLNELVGLTNLRAALNVWQRNSSNANEEFWQRVFATHTFVLSQRGRLHREISASDDRSPARSLYDLGWPFLCWAWEAGYRDWTQGMRARGRALRVWSGSV